MTTQINRTALIARLRELAEDKVLSVNYCVAVSHAADMLEADAPAVPQEPVAWQHRGRPAVNREWGDWHTVGYKPKGPECTRFMMRPLFAAPQQQPRLTDAEILEVLTNIDPFTARLPPGLERFARAIEAKVRGEA